MDHLKPFWKWVLTVLALFGSIDLAASQKKNLTNDIQESMICFMLNVASRLNKLHSDQIFVPNMVFSPMDLYGATALSYLGSNDGCHKKLAHVLGVKKPKPTSRRRRREATDFEVQVHKTIGKLLRNSQKLSKAAVSSGMGIYVHNEFAIKNIFIEDAHRYYNIDVKCTDFRHQPEPSTMLINNFIKNRTLDKVAEFFTDTVCPQTESVISSSLVLVANWKNMFNPDDTYETTFHTKEDGCDDTDLCVMMSQNEVPYYCDSKVTAVGIATASSNIIMYFVLPNENVTVTDLVSRPNKKFIKNIISNAKPRKVVYHIPKMRIEDQVPQLDVMHFSTVANINQNEVADNLTLSVLHQKVVFEINEEGIGGCPVKDAANVPCMQNNIDPNAVEFVVDKPFIFFVYNSRQKTFLYYGVIYKPSGYSNRGE